MTKNSLYYGDNLDVLRRYIQDESVDLVYLDPPFKSDSDYNVLFAEQDGSRAAAQIKAFGDMWQWDGASAQAYQEVVETGGQVSRVLQSFRGFLGDNDMLAYLAMMAPRLERTVNRLNRGRRFKPACSCGKLRAEDGKRGATDGPGVFPRLAGSCD